VWLHSDGGNRLVIDPTDKFHGGVITVRREDPAQRTLRDPEEPAARRMSFTSVASLAGDLPKLPHGLRTRALAGRGVSSLKRRFGPPRERAQPDTPSLLTQLYAHPTDFEGEPGKLADPEVI